jgi:hypothetical protein
VRETEREREGENKQRNKKGNIKKEKRKEGRIKERQQNMDTQTRIVRRTKQRNLHNTQLPVHRKLN